MLNNNALIKNVPQKEIKTFISLRMKDAMISIGQAVPDQKYFDTWRNEFSDFILNRYQYALVGTLDNFFSQIASGAVEVDKINSKSLITSFKKVYFKHVEKEKEQSSLFSFFLSGKVGKNKQNK